MNFKHLNVSTQKAVSTIEMNRPSALNALNLELMDELVDAFEHIGQSTSDSIVILKGNGPSFSVGFDLEAMMPIAADLATLDDGPLYQVAEKGRVLIETIRSSPNITLAAVHGHAIGGGFLLAAACDLCIVAQDTQCAIPEIDLGIPLTWGGIDLLNERIGFNLTRRFVLTGERFGMNELASVQFAIAWPELDALSAYVKAFAGTLSLKPPHSRRAVKAQFIERLTGGYPSDEDHFVECMRDPNFLNHAIRYLQKTGKDKKP